MSDHVVTPALDEEGDQFWLCSCGAEYTFMDQAIAHARKETIRANLALRDDEGGQAEEGQSEESVPDQAHDDEEEGDRIPVDLHGQASRYHPSLIQEFGAEFAQAGIVLGFLRKGISRQKAARRRQAAAERAGSADRSPSGVPGGGRG